MREFTGIYCKGYGVASGQAAASPIKGILQRQKEAIENLSHSHVANIIEIFNSCYLGTINLELTSNATLPEWRYIVPKVQWHPKAPPENLYFHPVTLIVNETKHAAYWYKGGDNFHENSKVEIIAPWIDGLILNESIIEIQYAR